MGIEFRSGTDSFYGEAVQKDIDPIVEMSVHDKLQKKLCWVEMSCQHRTFTGKDGEFKRTQIRVKSITPAIM